MIEKSIDKLCSVWNQLIQFKGELKLNMKVWHYEIFGVEVWNEHNVKIIIEAFVRAFNSGDAKDSNCED